MNHAPRPLGPTRKIYAYFVTCVVLSLVASSANARVAKFKGSAQPGGSNICGQALPNGCYACYDPVSGAVSHVSDTIEGAKRNCSYGTDVVDQWKINGRPHAYRNGVGLYLLPQPNPDTVKFEGHTPADYLYVTEFGSDGTRGVDIGLFNSKSFALQLDLIDIDDISQGGYIDLSYHGAMSSGPSQPFGSVRMTYAGSYEMVATVNNSALGGAGEYIEVFDDGMLVWECLGNTASIFGSVGATPFPSSVSRSADAGDDYRLIMRWPEDVSVSCSIAGGVGDEVRIRTLGATTSMNVLRSCGLTAKDVNAITIIDEVSVEHGLSGTSAIGVIFMGVLLIGGSVVAMRHHQLRVS